MNQSKNIFKEFQESKARDSSYLKERDNNDKYFQGLYTQSSQFSSSSFEKFESENFTKSEMLAEKLLEKVKREKERISQECQALRSQISQLLSD